MGFRHYVTINGISKTIAEWSRESGIRAVTIWSRIAMGWPEHRLLSKPVRHQPVHAGQRFSRLVVLEVYGTTKEQSDRRVRVRCDCGQEKVVRQSVLKRGATQSCGCYNQELRQANTLTHGHSRGGRMSPTYIVWRSLWRRCFAKQSSAYQFYGGVGVTMCNEWRYDFQAFLRHVGVRPEGAYLVRKDPRKGYEPGNVRWAPIQEMWNSIQVAIDDIIKPLPEWSLLSGVAANCIRQRLVRRKWPTKSAVFTPKGKAAGDYDVMKVAAILRAARAELAA